MRHDLKKGEGREAILEVASRLFYKQGYNATGIQQIIDEAGVSKGTFYTHFKSKDELGLEYMRRQHNVETIQLKESLAKIKDPRKRYLSFNTIMRDWMVETEYRGCAFANMAAEVTDGKSPIRKEAKFHYEAFRAVIGDMIEDLIKSDARYKQLDARYVTDSFMLISIGALTNATIYQDTWPYEEAGKSLRKLIGEA
jgi:AcrR family transcriptional regulator